MYQRCLCPRFRYDSAARLPPSFLSNCRISLRVPCVTPTSFVSSKLSMKMACCCLAPSRLFLWRMSANCHWTRFALASGTLRYALAPFASSVLIVSSRRLPLNSCRQHAVFRTATFLPLLSFARRTAAGASAASSFATRSQSRCPRSPPPSWTRHPVRPARAPARAG